MNELVTNQARYSIGIDLGTTHCVLSYLDLSQLPEDQNVQPELVTLKIPQLTKPGVIEEKSQLPSCTTRAAAPMSASE